MLIESSSAILKTSSQIGRKDPVWGEALICSWKEEFLRFSIIYVDSLEVVVQGMLYLPSSGVLNSSGSVLLRTFFMILDTMKLSSLKNGEGTLVLNMEYDKSRNYLGEIQFYNGSRLRNMGLRTNESLGGQVMQGKNGQKVSLYKGACKSKNFFSCLDESTSSERFTWVEDKYRDYQIN